MKKVIKVASVVTRICELTPSAATSDNDVLPMFGEVKKFNTVYWSDGLGDDEHTAVKAVSAINGRISVEPVMVAPDEPWVDVTPVKKYMDKGLTLRAVALLSEVMPADYDFVAAEDDYDMKVLTRQNVKINVQAVVRRIWHVISAPACADLFVEPFCEARDMDVMDMTLTTDVCPEKKRRNRIAARLESLGFSIREEVYNPEKISVREESCKWGDKIARALTEEFDDVAYVVANQKQRYDIWQDMVTPLFNRIFRDSRQVPRLRIKDLSK